MDNTILMFYIFFRKDFEKEGEPYQVFKDIFLQIDSYKKRKNNSKDVTKKFTNAKEKLSNHFMSNNFQFGQQTSVESFIKRLTIDITLKLEVNNKCTICGNTKVLINNYFTPNWQNNSLFEKITNCDKCKKFYCYENESESMEVEEMTHHNITIKLNKYLLIDCHQAHNYPKILNVPNLNGNFTSCQALFTIEFDGDQHFFACWEDQGKIFKFDAILKRDQVKEIENWNLSSPVFILYKPMRYLNITENFTFFSKKKQGIITRMFLILKWYRKERKLIIPKPVFIKIISLYLKKCYEMNIQKKINNIKPNNN